MTDQEKVKITIKQFVPDGEYTCIITDHSTTPATHLAILGEETKEAAMEWKAITEELQVIDKRLWAPDQTARTCLSITE